MRLLTFALAAGAAWTCGAGAALALEITSGLTKQQVIQRGPDNTGTVVLEGTATAPGVLKVTVKRGMSALPYFSDVEIARVSAGKWSVRVGSIPAGGPYTLFLSRFDDAARAAGGQRTSQTSVSGFYVGDLWVLAGQSNMVGRAELVFLETNNSSTMVLRPDDAWDRASEPLHERRERYGLTIGAGLGLAFANELYGRTKVPIGLIPCAKGGTSLWEWDPALRDQGRESLYGNMLARVKLAGGKVAGMLWYQGESDARPDRTGEYLGRLKKFVAAVRADFDQRELPVYFAQLSRNVAEENETRHGGTWNAIQEAHRVAAREIPHTGMVAGVDLELMDPIHLDTESLKRLGRRFAKLVCASQHRGYPDCAALKRGPDFIGARWDHPNQLRVSFGGVNGGLTAPGRIQGFTILDGDGKPLPVVFRVRRAPGRGSEILLDLAQRYEYPDALMLQYGRGLDPVCNLTDGEDMAVPAFGPVRLPPRPSLPGAP